MRAPELEKAKARDTADNKPWWEKTGDWLKENWKEIAAVTLTAVAVAALAAAVVLTGGVALGAIGAAAGAYAAGAGTMGALFVGGSALAGATGTLGLAGLLAGGASLGFGVSNNLTNNQTVQTINHMGDGAAQIVEFVSGTLISIGAATGASGDTSNKPKGEDGDDVLPKSTDTNLSSKVQNETANDQAKIPNAKISDLSPHERDMFERYDKAGWSGQVSGQTVGTRTNGKYQNIPNSLPTKTQNGIEISYKEFDINNKIPGQDRDANRFVIGSDGSIYITNDHYESFRKIK